MNIQNFSSSVKQVEASVAKLQEITHEDIQKYATELSTQFKEFKEGGEDLLREGNILKIGVVGQVKAGKSSFLNSLLFDGESVLPKASTPMTAGLTVLEYGETNTFEVEYYDAKEWNEFEVLNKQYQSIEQEVRSNKDFAGAPESFVRKEVQKRTSDTQQSAHELIERCGGHARRMIGSGKDSVPFKGVKGLQETLNQYVGAEGEFTSVVKSLYIHLHDERLKDIRIVDTPGVNDPIVSRENRTHQFLHSCHGVFFLSSASRFFDSKDMSFMNTRIGNKGVGTVVLLASKYDSVLQDLGLQLRGSQHEGDLEYADNLAQTNLKKRFETTRCQLENPSIQIQFNTTSGISFSIATKPQSAWDEVEANVVKQMKSFYPDAFSSVEEANDTFLMLANMEEMKEKYLEGTFIKDKETIIQHKMTEYFAESTKQVEETLEQAHERISHRLEELDSIELEDLHRQLKTQDQLFSSLKEEFKTMIGAFQNGLKGKVVELGQRIPRPSLTSVPTMQSSISVTYDRFIGTKTADFPITVLNTQELKERVCQQLEQYVSAWQEQWSNHFSNCKTKLFQDFCERITQFSMQTNDLKFSDSYYRNVMEQVLSDIDFFKTLPLRDELDDTINRVSNYCDSQELCLSSLSVDCKKSGVQAILNEKSRAIQNKAKVRVQQELTDFIKSVTPKADSNAKASMQKMEELKQTIAERLKGAGAEYIQKLEADIQTKQETKAKFESAKALLNEITNKIK